MLLIVDVFVEVEKDLIYEITKNGPHLIAALFFQHNIISYNQFELMQALNILLPSENSSMVLMYIVTENIKHSVTYEAFVKLLEQVPPLKHLHQKIIILGE